MFKKIRSHIHRSKEWYNVLRKENKLITNIAVKNKLLYQELEQACNPHGFLTFAEYLAIDQFGKHGYYANSQLHGQTDVEKRWAEALVTVCQKMDYDTMLEIGCGTGELGVATVKKYKQKTGKDLSWIGVDIDKNIHGKILANFASQHMQNSVRKIVSTIEELPALKKILVVFPYSLDNIPPHAFITIKDSNSYPTALLGMKAASGMLSETIVTPKQLQQKKIMLANGFFKQNGITYKLSAWKLRKGQRTYIATDAYGILYAYAKKFGKQSTFIIIDEIRDEPFYLNLENLGTPKSLYEKNLLYSDRPRYYRESGQHNLYYPLYKNSLLKFLTAIGFRSIDYDPEQKTSARLRGKSFIPISKKYTTFAIIASDFVEKKLEALPIPFTTRRII